MSKYYCLLVLLFISSIISRGQDLPSSEIIAKGIELYDNGDYDEAIENFLSVHENDSNYVYSQVELALCYLQTEDYDKLFQVGDRVLDEAGSYAPHLLFLLANGYDEASDPATAISFYRKSLSLAPYDALTHYNMGITYMNSGVLDSAYLCFQEAVRCNPLHASSHLGLGKLSARQGHLTKALLSLQTFLLIEPQSGRSNENLVYLENLANNYLDNSLGEPIEAFADNEGFEYYDHLIRAKIALNDEFESEIDLNVKYIKQTEMLYELKLFEQESDEFWCKAYFPFFKAVRQNGFFKHLAYLTLFSTNNETVVNWITRKSEEMQNFYQLGSYLNNIKNSREISIDGKTKILDCNFYDSGRIFSMGNRNKDGLEDGYWIYFYETGIKSGEGRFINGERTGEWKYYHEGGKLSSIEPYNKNKLDGKAKLFSEDGTLLSTTSLKDDQRVGRSVSYFPCGQIQEETDYSTGDGTVSGYALYPNGDTASFYKGINNHLEGEYISYFPKGRVSNITTYKDGVANGPYLNYSDKGTLLTEGNYNNDKKEGLWKDYFLEGQISFETNFNKGIETGTKTSYFRNGNPSIIYRMNEEGKYHGEVEFFNIDGSIRARETWENGRLKKVVSLGKEQEVIYEAGASDGSFTYINKDQLGNILTRGEVRDGMKTGTWKDFWKNGNTRMSYEFSDNKLNGKVKKFYQNGSIKEEHIYTNDTINGQSLEYYSNGVVSSRYNTKMGSYNGEILNYHPDGSLSDISFLSNGVKNGWQKEIGRGGKLITKDKYLNDLFYLHHSYDSAGNEIARQDFRTDKKYIRSNVAGGVDATGEMSCLQLDGEYKIYYPDGSLRVSSTISNGMVEGKYYRYFRNGKIETENEIRMNSRHGAYSIYYPDGSKRAINMYYADMKDGKWTFYFPNGNIERTVTYYDDLLHGNMDYFDSRGEFAGRLIYEFDELIAYQYGSPDNLSDTIPVDRPDMQVKTFYTNGKPALTIQLKAYMEDGEKKLLSSDGILIFKQELKDGLLNGPSVFNYPSGKPFEKTSYYYGCENGISRLYRRNGTLESEIQLWMDQRYGKCVIYNENGETEKTEIYWGDSYYGTADN